MILPNSYYFFEKVTDILEEIHVVNYKDVANISLTPVGLLAFEFLDDGPLRSIERLHMTGDGSVPDYMQRNHDEIVELQGNRLLFANYVAAAIFGTLSALMHSSLSGAKYAGMDDIISFRQVDKVLSIEDHRVPRDVLQKVAANLGNLQGAVVVHPKDVRLSLDFLGHTSSMEATFQVSDIRSCFVMNYQAAILYNEQHWEASLALNFALSESLINEILFSYGVVGSSIKQPFATKIHSIASLSKNQFRDLTLEAKIDLLYSGGLINKHLSDRLHTARRSRNKLMHKGMRVGPREAGGMQTAVRDLWKYLLEHPFELVAAYSVRM